MEATDYRRRIDPEYRRWCRKYPQFPGVAECLRLLQAKNVRGAWRDIIAHELTTHASECLSELVAAFWADEGERVKLNVLSAIADARLPAAIPFLAEVAKAPHPSLSRIAVQALTAVGTAEAHAAFWEARLC